MCASPVDRCLSDPFGNCRESTREVPKCPEFIVATWVNGAERVGPEGTQGTLRADVERPMCWARGHLADGETLGEVDNTDREPMVQHLFDQL
jgi:hypothetical protein